jgi:RNA polymerase sigma-70 factor (ECF subfamily)
MASHPQDATGDRALLAAAQGGDEDAFARLVEPYRGELTAHCYRMLGSLHDAEDELQEALLRAWRAIGQFEGRSSLRAWLYKIATNTCLSAIERRGRRAHPVDHGPRTDPTAGPGEPPLAESTWIEPFPDEALGVEAGLASPEASYERREAVEARLPERSQQATLRALGDKGVDEAIGAYLDAWYREDIDGVVAMLTEDATFSMPPQPTWFGGDGGPVEMAAFMAGGPLSGEWRWRHILTTANSQPTLAFYCWYEPEQAHIPFALNVLRFRDRKIDDVTCFITRSIEADERERYARWPEEPPDPRRTEDFFHRFGLPERIE